MGTLRVEELEITASGTARCHLCPLWGGARLQENRSVAPVLWQKKEDRLHAQHLNLSLLSSSSSEFWPSAIGLPEPSAGSAAESAV